MPQQNNTAELKRLFWEYKRLYGVTSQAAWATQLKIPAPMVQWMITGARRVPNTVIRKARKLLEDGPTGTN